VIVELRNPTRTVEFEGPMAVSALLAKLDLRREGVLVIREGTLVPGDDVLVPMTGSRSVQLSRGVPGEVSCLSGSGGNRRTAT